MQILTVNPPRPGAKTIVALIGALTLAFLAVQLVAGAPDAPAKSGKRTVLGKTKYRMEPNCGLAALNRDCTAEGKMTGYQSLMKGSRGRNFVVPYKQGRITSWSISLSRPTWKDMENAGKAQTPFFNALFGAPAKARIAVLRRVQKNKRGPPRFQMVRQSPTQILNPYFGRTVHFALSRPLYVAKGHIVALTIPTWAPAFWMPRACSVASYGGYINPSRCARIKQQNTFRASRVPKRCQLGFDPDTGEKNDALTRSRPQQRVGSVKRYGCYYEGNQLLYTATIVAK